jgi:hypothetical protein
MIRQGCAAAFSVLVVCSPSFAEAPFQFEAETILTDMQNLIRRDFHVGSSRDLVRAAFLTSGGATLKTHPTQAGVEKYIYDINLCSYYVWRWNISADFDTSGGLKQLYVNGEPALAEGSPPRALPKVSPEQKGAVIKIIRPRPEAFKGKNSLAAIVMDHDGNLATIDDQELLGAGPTRADPANLGSLHVYHVEPWRSIFDMDAANAIVPYSGGCAAADAAAARAKPH